MGGFCGGRRFRGLAQHGDGQCGGQDVRLGRVAKFGYKKREWAASKAIGRPHAAESSAWVLPSFESTGRGTAWDGPEFAKRARELCAAFARLEVGLVVVDCGGEVWARNHQSARWGIEPGAHLSAEHPVLRRVRYAAVNGSAEADPLLIEVLPWGERSGSWRLQFTSLQPFGFGPGALVWIHDLSELYSLQTQLERTHRLETLGRLVSSVAHDFNNLLTGIRGSLAMIRHGGSERSRLDALDAADAAARRASEVTRQLLSFGRVDKPPRSRAAAVEVLKETMQLVRCIPDTAAVRAEIGQDLGLVEIGPSQLHQIVLNLLMNACDAAKPTATGGNVTLRASALRKRNAQDEEEQWLQITVEDTGPGMDGATRARIFEPFFTTKSASQGTGLGLANVKALVEHVGGWIEVESVPARGSSFHVYLPAVGEGEEEVEDSARPSSSHGETVLICDDESRLANLTAGLLEEFGYGAAAVAQGGEALEWLLRNPGTIRVLLLDVNLTSGMSARELLSRLVKARVKIPVILTSGLAADDVPEGLRRHELVSSYLAKPYTVEELTRAVGVALEGV